MINLASNIYAHEAFNQICHHSPRAPMLAPFSLRSSAQGPSYRWCDRNHRLFYNHHRREYNLSYRGQSVWRLRIRFLSPSSSTSLTLRCCLSSAWLHLPIDTSLVSVSQQGKGITSCSRIVCPVTILLTMDVCPQRSHISPHKVVPV